MQFPRTILVIITDNVINARVLEKALQFAEQGNIGIHLLKVEYEPVTDLTEVLTQQQICDIRQQSLTRNQCYLMNLCQNIQKRGIRCDHRIVWHRHLPEAIEESVRLLTPDLVIKPISSESSNPFAMPVERRLLRYCEAPMLLLRESSNKTGPVLAAIDPTNTESVHQHLDNCVLQCSQMMSRLFAVPWHVISAYVDCNQCRAITKTGNIKEELSEQIALWHGARLEEKIKAYSLTKSHIHLLPGKPEVQIPHLASKIEAQLVVMGTVGKCGLPDSWLCNTAERVLAELQCDVLALPPDQISHVDALL